MRYVFKASSNHYFLIKKVSYTVSNFCDKRTQENNANITIFKNISPKFKNLKLTTVLDLVCFLWTWPMWCHFIFPGNWMFVVFILQQESSWTEHFMNNEECDIILKGPFKGCCSKTWNYVKFPTEAAPECNFVEIRLRRKGSVYFCCIFSEHL